MAGLQRAAAGPKITDMEERSGRDSLRILPSALLAALDWAQACLPDEACGLLAGRQGRIERFLPVGNKDPSPDRFSTEPASLTRAHRAIRESGLEWRGVFHSHPRAEAFPSEADARGLALAPDMCLIASILPGRGPECRAFRRMQDRFEEIPV